MAAIVCHGLQSCLEPQLVESRSLTFTFPFSSKSHSPQQNPIDFPYKTSFCDSNSKTQERHSNNSNKTTDTNTGWSFLQALSNVPYASKESSPEKESVYVHPQTKRSSNTMSQKSLELCTEKLGNETGSDIVENNGCDDMDLLCSWPTREQQERPRVVCSGGIRKTRTQNFPPPLTTLRGSESLRVRSHREDGRLVVEAIRVPPIASCFQAERSHGRLRLCFLKNNHDNFDPEDTQASDDDNEGVEEECESDSEDSERREQVEASEAAEDEEEEEEETEEEGGGEMRRKEYERPRGCKEGRQHENNELLNNWGKPLSVAIS